MTTKDNIKLVFESTLEELPLWELISTVNFYKINGISIIKLNDKETFSIYFEDGEPGNIVSSRPQDKLSQLLIELDILTPQLWNEMLKLGLKTELQQSSYLLEKEIITSEQILSLLKIRFLRTLYFLFKKVEGKIYFQPGISAPSELPLIKFNALEILYEGIMNILDYHRVKEIMPFKDKIIILNKSRLDKLNEISLLPWQQVSILMINNKKKVSDIIRLSPCTEEMALRFLAFLMVTRLIEYKF